MIALLNHLKAAVRCACPLLLLSASLFGSPAARADVHEEFAGSVLGEDWTTEDGFAAQYPADVGHFANFQTTGSHLSISFPGGREHNQWWFQHAQATRPFLGDGAYVIKVDSAITGSQQFGLTFESSPGTFMQFMMYGNEEIFAYVERFARVNDSQYKVTVAGKPLGISVPTSGPYYLRVTLQGHSSPGSRNWTFGWSKNGAEWNEVVSGVLETWNPSENAGAIQRVGVFAGNQPMGFDAFDARLDYFSHSAPAASPIAAPVNLVARALDHEVELWWAPAASADSYGVYRSSSAEGPYSLLEVTAAPSYVDLTVANDTPYFYAVTAFESGVESDESAEVSIVPHAPTEIHSLPTAGLTLAMSAAELAHQLSDGQSVVQWPNAAGARITAFGSASTAPRFVAASINGKPAVRFDGVDDFLTLSSGFQEFTAGISMYVVARPTVLQSGFKLLALGNGPGQQNIVLGRAGSTAGLQYFTDNSAGNVAWFNTSAGLNAGEALLLSLSQQGGAANSSSYAEVARNGVAIGGQNVWVPPVTARSVNYIGKSYWNEGLFQGDVAEILMYNRSLSAQEESAIRNYVSAKYGIGDITPPPPPPLETPATLTAVAGSAVVELSWSAVSSAIGYRVYRADSPAGELVQFADVGGLTLIDGSVVNGVTYRYVVTAYSSTTESDASQEVLATPLLPEAEPEPEADIPTAGLILSLDATATALYISPGSPVTVWQDESTSGNSALSGSGAPILVSNAINGRPALRFDGIDDYLTLPGGFQNFTAGITLYVVARPAILQSGFKLLALGNGGGQQNIVLGRAGATSGLQYFTDSTSGGTGWFNTPGGLVAGESMFLSVVQGGGAANSLSYAQVSKNGAVLAGANVWVPPVTLRSVNYIGKSFWNEGLFQGDIAEVLLYDRALNAEEQAAVRQYIVLKYGLQVQ